MLITSAGELGKPESVVLKLVKQNKIGGVVFLKGNKKNHKRMIDCLNAISESQNQLPLLYSIDAESSLFNRRLQRSKPVMNTIDIKTAKQSILSLPKWKKTRIIKLRSMNRLKR